ncbi:zinc ABC transporter substrate-binding protein [Thalassovita mangrovi]|uniref:High-affinity zinc uptake system protein ZnuA n=1 Tax=Thalassovita mangrovi TaxID=2692236 RepID=A0A6L8LF37_9RHOB|nr:zinc ABC transporter substrate-binding protein [Thalassovita mangrovi]MYM54435.1 zinc ABC transporter solute-binding protein [Thalassovita mangrovi]
MMKPALALPLIVLAQAAHAEVPKVVTDIAPIQSLAAQVMGDLGSPSMIVEPGASPHGYSMRPSQAKALDQADVVFWVGHPLAPWLEAPLERLAGKAVSIELLEVDGTVERQFRETAVFAAEDGHEEHDAHDHDKADEHDHDHDAHDGHAEAETDHDAQGEDVHGHEGHDHDHNGLDPHAWLDPQNGKVWLGAMAAALAEADPEHADIYRSNAKAAQDDLDQQIGRIQAVLEPVADKPFVVFHDAYQYFEARFGLRASGAISLSDATAPSPARIMEIRDEIHEHGVVCVFSEPQFNPGLVATVFEGSDARTAVIDPLGTKLETGPALYGTLLDELAGTMAECLK